MLTIDRHNILVTLDIGTDTIKAALGQINQTHEISLLGLVTVPARGVKQGSVVNIEDSARSIEKCLNELERQTGFEILSAITGFSEVGLEVRINHAVIAIANRYAEINREEKERVLDSAQKISLPPGKTVMQVIERQYFVDGYGGIINPLGMSGNRLEVEVLAIIAASTALQNLQKSVERINLTIDGLIYNQLLAAEAVLMPAEKDIGVALIDMGAGTTEVSVFYQGTMLSSSVLPIGSEYIDNDLAIVLRTSAEEAVRIKENFGVATPESVDDIMINVFNLQGSKTRPVSQRLIAEIISARLLEMLDMIYDELEDAVTGGIIAGGIVFTGGGSRLSGFVELMETYMGLPVRAGFVDNLQGLKDNFKQPQNAVVLGGLVYGFGTMQPKVINHGTGILGVINRINYWIRDLFS